MTSSMRMMISCTMQQNYFSLPSTVVQLSSFCNSVHNLQEGVICRAISFCINLYNVALFDPVFSTKFTLYLTQFIIYLTRRDRHCESPFETFFKDQCLPIRNIEVCPENMEIYDGPNNEGFCDCSDVKGNNTLRMIYWDETGQCYLQNTQVYKRLCN